MTYADYGWRLLITTHEPPSTEQSLGKFRASGLSRAREVYEAVSRSLILSEYNSGKSLLQSPEDSRRINCANAAQAMTRSQGASEQRL